jgi:uncharacterized membrane protein
MTFLGMRRTLMYAGIVVGLVGVALLFWAIGNWPMTGPFGGG